MSRLTPFSFDYCPDDLPSPFSERDADTLPEKKRQPWKRDQVWIFRQSLMDLGLTAEQIDQQIEKTCGLEWSERAYLTIRQAG